MSRVLFPAFILAVAVTSGARPAGAGDDETHPPLPHLTHFDVLAGYGGALGPTAGFELLVGPGAEVWTESEGFRGVAGFRLQLHGGPRGGKLGLGVGLQADIEADDFRGPVAFGVQAAVVHRRRDDGRSATYTGPELEVSAWRLQATVGVLQRVHGHGPGRVLFDWGLGVRF